MKFFTPILVVLLGLSFGLNVESVENKDEVKLICDGKTEKIECKDKLHVNIKSAQFIQKANVCEGVPDGSLVCTSSAITDNFNKTCHDKNSCAITADKSSVKISEECAQQNLLLQIKYICSGAKAIYVKYNVAYVLLFVGLFVYSM